MIESTEKFTRAVKKCAPGHMCSMEEINEIARELINEMDDPNIDRYENPSEEQMRRIIERAKAYTGNWYHTEITFPLGASEMKFGTVNGQKTTHSELVHRIEELGEDHGIFLMYEDDVELPDRSEKILR